MTVLPLRTNRVTMDIYPVARFELGRGVSTVSVRIDDPTIRRSE
jgi:hypothetical protein